ncbi:MAG: FAD-dependent thymidylate synthase [Candidatus Aminicenantes bacterium]|nr:FAD-dependent thymidylate synthase [Candidatus Aminicenantes bacterium]
MKVILAGYNVDADVLQDLLADAPPRADATPETLSAAYARISRHPEPVDELRRRAREEVEKARLSNRTIIFKMGHHSVAEHAVFNFDLLGVSRLAIEEVEHFRLCSFTEKSQRYIKLEDDFVLPQEVRQAGLSDLFVKTVRAQNAFYLSLYDRLKPYFFEARREWAAHPGNQAILEGWAKEDARYTVSLATEGQLGMTVNARNLELLIRRFACADLDEVRTLNRALFALAKSVAPSIVLFTEACELDALTYRDLAEEAARLLGRPGRGMTGPGAGSPVRLVQAPRDGDTRILAALLHKSSGRPYRECLQKAVGASAAGKKKIFKTAWRHMEFYDFPQREFEFADLAFELVVSAACFAQLKRHRMATLTVQPYDPGLGVTVPPSFVAVGAEKEFMEIADRTSEVYAKLKKKIGRAAEYILTNAHRRRALLKTNARELYHISRLREDATAQWDIRAVAGRMSEAARKAMPLSFLLLGGKDAYPSLYRKLYGRSPKLMPPKFWHDE